MASARPGCAVAEHADGDARGHVEVAAAVDVEERAPLAARHDDRRLAVVVDEQAAARRDEIVLLRHRATLPPLVRRLSVPPHRMSSRHGRLAAGPARRPSSAPPPRCPAYSATQARGQGAAARGVRPAGRGGWTRRWSCSTTPPSSGATASSRSSTLGVPRTLGDIQERYREHALGLGRKVAAAGAGAGRASRRTRSISIVTASCTGHHDPVARRLPGRRPGAAARRAPAARSPSSGARAARRRWRARTTSWSASPDARALVIAVELPSLSMQRADLSPANLVATALFGDGAAAAVLAGGDVAPAAAASRILETLSHIWPRSTYALGLRSQGRRVSLRAVEGRPGAAQERDCARWSTRWRRARGLGARASFVCFVLHPGGRKILGVRRGGAGPHARRHAAVVGRAARLRQPVERVGAVRAARVADAAAAAGPARTASWRRSARA